MRELTREGRRVARAALLLAGAGATAMVLASPAGARDTAAPATLYAGPVTVHGYRLTLVAATGGSLSVLLVRKAGGATQTHAYSFTLHGSALRIAPNLGSATLQTGRQLGAFGSITMRLVRPGKLTRVTGCGGSSAGRRGTLAGSFRLVLDTTFFHTVVEKALPAQLARGVVKNGCAPTPPPRTRAGLTLTAISGLSQGAPSGPVFAASRTAAGATTESFMVMQRRAPATIVHAIVASVGASAFTAADDLSSAHVDGTPGAPFLGGTLDFASQVPAQGAGGCSQAPGQLTGSLVAHFDSIGDQTVGGGMGILVKC